MSQANRDSLQLVTFNVRFGSADDGSNSWEYRRSIFYNNVRLLAPGIMATQEGLFWQLEEILYGIGSNYKYVGSGRDDGKQGGEYCAIIYDSTKYKVLQNGTFWLSDTPATPGPTWNSGMHRICTWAQFENIHSHAKLIIYNTHLDWESMESQAKSIPLIMSYTKQWTEKDGNIVVTGDFNANKNSVAYGLMIQNKFVDSYLKCHPNASDNISTYHGFGGNWNLGKIDFVWIKSEDFRVVKGTIDQYNENGKYPSDHFAVTAELINHS